MPVNQLTIYQQFSASLCSMRPVSLNKHGLLLLRAMGVVALATALAIASISTAKAGIAKGAPGETGAIHAVNDTGNGQDASRSSSRCTAPGFCWGLPLRSAGLPARLADEIPHPSVEKVKAEAKWSCGPAEQPPRGAA
jgi:hypothetical protein